jgi:hypothetical protein
MTSEARRDEGLVAGYEQLRKDALSLPAGHAPNAGVGSVPAERNDGLDARLVLLYTQAYGGNRVAAWRRRRLLSRCPSPDRDDRRGNDPGSPTGGLP